MLGIQTSPNYLNQEVTPLNYFGIDVHDTYHKVCCLTPHGEVFEYDINNDDECRAKLREIVAAHQPATVAMEACTGAYELHALLDPVAEKVSLLHPGDFRTRFPKRGKKNDRIDARALCEAARMEVKGIWVPDEEIRQRRILSTRRVSLTQKRTAAMSSLKSLFREYNIPLPKSAWSDVGRDKLRARLDSFPETVMLCARLELDLIEHFNEALKEIDQRMAELASDDRGIRLLMSIPGISYYSAFVITSEIGDSLRFKSAKQLTAYAGLCPRLSQSGMSKARLGSITKNGRARLRWIVVECANSAILCNQKIQRLYWRVKKRSGCTSKAKVAAGRKLLCLCYHILKSGQLYSESIEEKHKAKLRKMEGVAKKRKAA